jgi:hypothetical protein
LRVVRLGAVVLAVLWAAPAAAQTGSRPGPWAFDVRGVTSPVPGDPAFYPPLDASARIPARGFGVDVGAHVYLVTMGPARLGVGASIVTVRATTTPPAPVVAPGSATAAPAAQSIELDMQSLAPQVSFNFGTRNGWSYLSAGYGAMIVNTTTTGVAPAKRATGESWELRRLADVGDYNALNVGGGARWFLKSRMAFTFDVRLYRVSAGTVGPVVTETVVVEGETSADPPAVPEQTPGRMQLIVGAGLSFR